MRWFSYFHQNVVTFFDSYSADQKLLITWLGGVPDLSACVLDSGMK
jgi:hypothetical protein